MAQLNERLRPMLLDNAGNMLERFKSRTFVPGIINRIKRFTVGIFKVHRCLTHAYLSATTPCFLLHRFQNNAGKTWHHNKRPRVHGRRHNPVPIQMPAHL